MADLGVYNFVKNALAVGRSREEIEADLARGGQSPEAIEETFAAVAAGKAPRPKPLPTPAPERTGGFGDHIATSRSSSVSSSANPALAALLLIAIIVVAGLWMRAPGRLSALKAVFDKAHDQYVSRIQQIDPPQPHTSATQ